MASISVTALIPNGDPARIFCQIERFEDYPSIAESCRAVVITMCQGDELISSWEVNFRNGILKWQEHDVIDRPNLRIRFHQIEGDLAAFSGEWAVTSDGGEVSVRFTAEFDLGMPSLASMLHPVAERAFRSNVVEVIRAFGDAVGTPVETVQTDEEMYRASDRHVGGL